MQKAQIDAAVARYKADLDARVKIQVEQMRAEMEHERESNRIMVDGAIKEKEVESKAKPSVQLDVSAQMKEANETLKGVTDSQTQALMQAMGMMNEGLQALAQAIARPRTIVRGKDGKAMGVQ